MRLSGVVGFAGAMLLTASIWTFAFRIPESNLFLGPINGLFFTLARHFCVRGGNRPAFRMLSLALYALTVVATASALSLGLLPWPYSYRPGLAGMFLGVHGSGIFGVLGLIAGALVAIG